MTKDLRLKIYPAVIGVLGICLLASLFTNVQIEVNRGGAPTVLSEPEPAPTTSAEPLPSPIAPPASLPSAAREATPSATPDKPLPSIGVTAEGALRVSNQTGYPLRVALLSQQSEDKTAFNQPVHWDFAPGEGEAKGLILSLPNQNLKLQPGDVLVAFAQDGSRRYWGPYVVSKTSLPVWNAAAGEWQLTLQP